MSELEIFKNEEFGEIRTVLINQKPYFVANDIANILDYKRPADAITTHCKGSVKHRVLTNGGNQSVKVIPEGDVYRLIVKASTQSQNKNIQEKAEKFESWIFDEVLPTIRKTGGYVNNDNLFIETYLPFADNQTRLLFTTTLKTVRKQNELIKQQQEEIEHKQEVINGLTDDIDIYKKKDIINRICRRIHDNYANRYKELYKCFRENYHIDLEARCEGYNLKQIKKKDRLSVIKYAEQFGYIDDLYLCCVKLYEAEVREIIEDLNELHI